MTDLNALSKEQLIALLAKAQANAKQPQRITMKVTAKKADGSGTDGALSLYGLGRYPVTLYRSQWERLFAAVPEVEAFISTNASLLKDKAPTA